MPIDFKKLIFARLLLTLGTQIQAVVLGWQMYVLTGNPLFLGLIGLTEAVPALGLALYAGYVVDRGNPLKLYRHVVELSLLSAIVMLCSQAEAVQLSHDQKVLCLFTSSFLTGLARAFAQPSVYALVPRIVPRAFLSRAAAWTTSAIQVGRITGPAVGGILFAWIGCSGTAAIVTLVLLFGLAACFSIKSPEIVHVVSASVTSFKTELLSGFRFVVRHPVLYPALLLDMVSVLFAGVTALLPIYAAEILHVGPEGLGTLRAAPAIGAVTVSLLLTVGDIRARAGEWLVAAVVGFGISTLVFALSDNLVLSVVALGCGGVFDSISVHVRSSAVQLFSPDAMRGRISAVNSIFISSSNELGEFESGMLAHLVGVVPTAVFGGVVCLITVAGIVWFYPGLRILNLRDLDVLPESE